MPNVLDYKVELLPILRISNLKRSLPSKTFTGSGSITLTLLLKAEGIAFMTVTSLICFSCLSNLHFPSYTSISLSTNCWKNFSEIVPLSLHSVTVSLPVEKLMFSWVILSCFCSISQSISACRAGNIFRSSCTTRDLQFDGYSLLFHSAGRWWSVNNFTLGHKYSHYYQLPIKQSTVNQAVFNKQVNLSSTRQLVNHKSGMFGLHLGQPWLPANKNKWDH